MFTIYEFIVGVIYTTYCACQVLAVIARITSIDVVLGYVREFAIDASCLSAPVCLLLTRYGNQAWFYSSAREFE